MNAEVIERDQKKEQFLGRAKRGVLFRLGVVLTLFAICFGLLVYFGLSLNPLTTLIHQIIYGGIFITLVLATAWAIWAFNNKIYDAYETRTALLKSAWFERYGIEVSTEVTGYRSETSSGDRYGSGSTIWYLQFAWDDPRTGGPSTCEEMVDHIVLSRFPIGKQVPILFDTQDMKSYYIPSIGD